MADELNNENKTNLLFKKFQGVAQTSVIYGAGIGGTSYSSESKKSNTGVFKETVYIEEVPFTNPVSLFNLWSSSQQPQVPDTSWNTTYKDQTISFVDLSDNSGKLLPLRYYHRVYLQQTNATNQAWWLIDLSSSDDFTNNNILLDTIPYLYNDQVPSMYTPIVEYYDGTSWVNESQNEIDGLNWAMDAATGILQFYQDPNTLQNDRNINITDVSSQQFKRPRISFIKYTGKKGDFSTGGGSGSGLITVGDTSNSPQDVSAIYFDISGFDVSFNTNGALITNKGSSSNVSSDISSVLYNIPLAPTDGSGILNENLGSGTIILSWSNPVNKQSALPFGTYTSYPDGSNNQSDNIQIRRLPFHQHINIEYLLYDAGTPSGEWTPLTIDNSSSAIQTVLPNTLTSAYLTSSGGNPIQTDLCGNNGVNVAPFNRVSYNGLELGKGYQFRIYMDNSGTNTPVTDPIYLNDASWNYLYIPNLSGDFIELGSFGIANAPTDAIISMTPTFQPSTFSIELSTTGTADVCLNTPFNSGANNDEINSNLNLTYAFGISVSGEVDLSNNNQMEDKRYDVINGLSGEIFGFDISSILQKKNNVAFNESSLISDLSVCPQYKYTLTNLYGFNNVGDPSYTLVYNLSGVSFEFITPKPTRTEAITTSNYQDTITADVVITNYDISKIDISGYNEVFEVRPGNTPTTNDQSVTFLENSSNFTGEVINGSGKILVANNFGTIHDKLIGKDTSGRELSYLDVSIQNSNIIGDTSANPSIGYLQEKTDLSNQYFNIDTSVVEAGKTPNFQYQGYYTGLDLTKLDIRNINLSKYPDICNNSYNPYELRLKHFYNDPSVVAGTNWTTSGKYLFKDFIIGKRPNVPIDFSLNGYTNPNPSLGTYLQGQQNPGGSSIINIDFSYNISDIDATWASTTIDDIGGLCKFELYYQPNGPGPVDIVDSEIEPFPNPTTITNVDFDPQLKIPNIFYTDTQKYSRTYNTTPQFQIKGTVLNNVTYTPDPQNIPPQDISFGTSGKSLWWDYTWGGGGLNSNNNPDNFFGTTASNNNAQMIESVGFSTFSVATTYNHQNLATNKQLLWANGAFRGVISSINQDYPYTDLSNVYYNPSGQLKDYSNFDINGLSGETINTQLTSNRKWWFDASNSGVISRVQKYITFNIDAPIIPVTSGNIPFFKLIVEDSNGTQLSQDSSKTSASNGYWVYHTENNNSTIEPSTSFSGTIPVFDGQIRVNNTWPGSWLSNVNSQAYRIFTNSSSLQTTTLQITVGLPSTLSASSSSIRSIDVEFGQGP